MNARLYPPGHEAVNDRDHVVAIFSAAFANEPDLAGYSAAAHRVLAASAALFLERGAANTSVRDLTRACGLSPGALYNHFPSKDELLFTIVRHGHDRMRRHIDEALEPAKADPVAGFCAFVSAYVAGHVRQPELAQLSRQEYLHLSPRHCGEIVELRRGMRRTLSALIRRGEQAGRFHVLGDVVGQTLMVLDMCSRTSEWYDRSRDTDEQDIVARYVQAALRLVGAA